MEGLDLTSDLTALTAAEIVSRVHDGRSSAVDVARAHLARIAAHDPEIGAFAEHDPERVLAEAGGVDSRADRFALPLAGVPVVVPDDVDVAGYPTRHGSAATRTDPARRDDELVKRMRAAGAVVIGKARMPELAVWGFSHGVTRNPLDPTLDPGGSGVAAAVAARMAVLAIATDGGGAIRNPAACCGLVGLKPGPQVVPLPRGADEHWCGLGATGPLARTAGDAALLLGVLTKSDIDLDVPGPRRIALSLRVPWPVGRLQPDHRAAAIGGAARLRAGPDAAIVAFADPPYPRGLATQWLRRWQAGVAREADAIGLDLDAAERRTAAVVRKGRRVLRFTPPAAGAPAAWRDRVLAWMDEGGYDMLLGPATIRPPVRAGAMVGQGYRTSVLAMATRLPCAPAWNLAGLPAVVAPVLIGGRPVGVQLVGRPGAEAALLATAARLERRAVPTAGAAAPRVYA
ncbi:amidase [Pseudonocardia kunmingensis]|uniref:Amidase n=1 Tax=Pseudonocardia kunmingensis TaxID=630975 RepID=A0A543DLQ1_9PSEU|nr:amidase family protein [Pseudonocardia kunmingensis]TQM10241.1 amidase [Pseudonocardia kunmingensis]